VHSVSAVEPRKYKQFQQHFDANLWCVACEEEMEVCRLNGTWEIVKLCPGKCAIGSRWFLKVKHNANGFLDCYKDRVVAKGYSQQPGFDFKKTFAPIVHFRRPKFCIY
jgi:Reverse transcriptase (RNA-dependent DNA polymerase)